MAKYDLSLSFPLMNAAGILGFAPDRRCPVDLTRLGAFVTNPVSLGPRTPARGQRYLPFTGGFLLHTGHPNPGFKSVLRRYVSRWKRSPVPVIVHTLVQGVDDAAMMAARLEGVEGVMGLELGLPPGVGVEDAYAMVAAGCGELPLVVRLPFEQAGELALEVIAAGAAAVSVGAPRGALTGPDGEIVHGRLYGPAIFPGALAVVRALARDDVPVIGAGGIYRQEQVAAMLAVGAMAVQLDAVLWRGEAPLERFEPAGEGA